MTWWSENILFRKQARRLMSLIKNDIDKYLEICFNKC